MKRTTPKGRGNRYALLWAVAAALITGFGQELAAGHVPIPTEWRWAIPIVIMAIAATSPYLRMEAEDDDDGG